MSPKSKSENWIRLIADDNYPRLDSFLARLVPGLSRARAQKLIDEKNVQINNVVPRASQKVRVGTEVLYHIPSEARETALLPENIPLDVLYEDDSVIAINKPAGLVVHPAHGNWSGTLVNALLNHCGGKLGHGSFNIGGELRPGIVHRIDKNTSGILIVAKTDAAHAFLAAQFKDHSISRKYCGICWGILPKEGEWNKSLARDPQHRKRMAIIESGKKALTRFRTLEHFGVATYFEAELFTGRTHQIRVHFSAAGFPLIGDEVYGNATRSARRTRELYSEKLRKLDSHSIAQLTELTQNNKRQMLHAQYLKIARPEPQAPLELSAEPPEDFQKLLKILKGTAGSIGKK